MLCVHSKSGRMTHTMLMVDSSLLCKHIVLERMTAQSQYTISDKYANEPNDCHHTVSSENKQTNTPPDYQTTQNEAKCLWILLLTAVDFVN